MSESKARNHEMDLTGHLHLEDGLFYQWLEGPPEALEGVRRKIARDIRHHSMETLWKGEQSERQFGNWHMGFGISDPGTLFNWVAQRGVSVSDMAEFSRGVLAFMRAA